MSTCPECGGPAWPDPYQHRPECHHYTAANDTARMLELLRDVADSPPEFDMPPLRYLSVQVDRATWDAMQALIAEVKPPAVSDA